MFTKVLKNYQAILKNVDSLIIISGYKMSFVASEMGMDKTTFYYKRKHGTFTPAELAKLLDIIKADELKGRVSNLVDLS